MFFRRKRDNDDKNKFFKKKIQSSENKESKNQISNEETKSEKKELKDINLNKYLTFENFTKPLDALKIIKTEFDAKKKQFDKSIKLETHNNTNIKKEFKQQENLNKPKNQGYVQSFKKKFFPDKKIEKDSTLITYKPSIKPSIENSQESKVEPRDMRYFIMKPVVSNQRMFPYITPQMAYEKNYPFQRSQHKKQVDKGVLRIIPFGGLEQVGLNCMAFEYGNEIIIIDMGMQFPDEHMHGIHSRIPDISYLKGKNVIGVIITHGHIDHIGAVPFLMRELGSLVPIYSGAYALELIKLRQEEYKIPLNMKEMKLNKIYQIGISFYVEPFTVDHSIPDSMGLRIHTPVGKFIHTGDWKFDQDPREGVKTTNHELLKKYGKDGVRALLSDSTNAYLSGSSLNEKIVVEPIEDIFKKAKGRIITGTFSSIIERLQIIIDTAEKFDRKVVLLGRGMHNYFEIAKRLGYIKNRQGTLIDMSEAEKLPFNKICICCTGAQGERYAALMRISTGESKDTKIYKGDTIILSSSVIPGNEKKVQELMDIIHEQGGSVHHYRQTNIHAGGHAREEDVKQMIKEVHPKVFIPIYGNRFMIHANAKIAFDLGYPKEKIFMPRNGQIIEFTKTNEFLTQNYASNRMVTVDGYLIGFTTEKEFLERFQMLHGGVLIVNVTPQKKKPVKVFLISHGFINFHIYTNLKEKIIEKVRMTYKTKKEEGLNRDDINHSIRKKVQSIVFDETGKQPVVIVAS